MLNTAHTKNNVGRVCRRDRSPRWRGVVWLAKPEAAMVLDYSSLSPVNKITNFDLSCIVP